MKARVKNVVIEMSVKDAVALYHMIGATSSGKRDDLSEGFGPMGSKIFDALDEALDPTRGEG